MTDELYKELLASPNPLKGFFKWYIRNITNEKCLPLEIPEDGINIVSKLFGLTLFKKYPFQVQLWIGQAGERSPTHTHPDVDAYEVYLTGKIAFTKKGIPMPNLKFGQFVRINSDDSHEAIMEGDGCFLSIQYWKNNVPATSIEKNWCGGKLSDDHVVLN